MMETIISSAWRECLDSEMFGETPEMPKLQEKIEEMTEKGASDPDINEVVRAVIAVSAERAYGELIEEMREMAGRLSKCYHENHRLTQQCESVTKKLGIAHSDLEESAKKTEFVQERLNEEFAVTSRLHQCIFDAMGLLSGQEEAKAWMDRAVLLTRNWTKI
jgi:hypothetical protein